MGDAGVVLRVERAVGVQRLHRCQRVGDHGDGFWRHERDVVGGAAQRERVVRRAGEPERVVRLQGLALVLVLQLLHLQGHELLVLEVRDIVADVPLWAEPPAGLVAVLVLLVVKRSEGQDVQEEQGGTHCDSHTQFSGVIPSGLDD